MSAQPVLAFARGFLDFLAAHKRYWLLPLLVVLILMGLLVLFTQGADVAPRIYSGS